MGKKSFRSEVEELGVSGVWGVTLQIDWLLENPRFLSFENVSVKKGGTLVPKSIQERNSCACNHFFILKIYIPHFLTISGPT